MFFIKIRCSLQSLVYKVKKKNHKWCWNFIKCFLWLFRDITFLLYFCKHRKYKFFDFKLQFLLCPVPCKWKLTGFYGEDHGPRDRFQAAQAVRNKKIWILGPRGASQLWYTYDFSSKNQDWHLPPQQETSRNKATSNYLFYENSQR